MPDRRQPRHRVRIVPARLRLEWDQYCLHAVPPKLPDLQRPYVDAMHCLLRQRCTRNWTVPVQHWVHVRRLVLDVRRPKRESVHQLYSSSCAPPQRHLRDHCLPCRHLPGTRHYTGRRVPTVCWNVCDVQRTACEQLHALHAAAAARRCHGRHLCCAVCQRVLRLNDERGSLHGVRPWMCRVRRRRGVHYLHGPQRRALWRQLLGGVPDWNVRNRPAGMYAMYGTVCHMHVCIDGVLRDLCTWLLARALQRDLRCCVPEELLQPRRRVHTVRFFMCHLQRPHCRQLHVVCSAVFGGG